MRFVAENGTGSVHNARGAAAFAATAVFLVSHHFPRYADHALLRHRRSLFRNCFVRLVFVLEAIQIHVRELQFLNLPPIRKDAAFGARVTVAQLAQLGQIALTLLPRVVDRPLQHPRPVTHEP